MNVAIHTKCILFYEDGTTEYKHSDVDPSKLPLWTYMFNPIQGGLSWAIVTQFTQSRSKGWEWLNNDEVPAHIRAKALLLT